MVQSLLKGYTVKHPPKPVKLGFWFLQGSWGFQGLNQVPYTHIHFQAPTGQVSRLTRSSCTVKNPNCFTINCRGQNGHLAVKSQNFWSTSYFEATIIIWSSLDHDSTSMAQKSSRCKNFYFWTAEKSTVTWPRHNFFMVHQKNPIQSSFLRGCNVLQLIFTFQVQEMLSQKVINFYIIGQFQKSTKMYFKSKTITWDW